MSNRFFTCLLSCIMTRLPTIARKLSGCEKKWKRLSGRSTKKWTIHDFRMVPGPTHTNLIFDVVIPSGETRKNTDLKKEIDGRLQQEDQTYFTVVTFDRKLYFLKWPQYWARCPGYRKPSLEILTRGGFLQIAGPFSRISCGRQLWQVRKGRALAC